MNRFESKACCEHSLARLTLVVLAALALHRDAPGQSTQSTLAGHDAAPAAPKPVRFAVIGDYGIGSAEEASVASLVASWNPEFVITTGDNNYPSGDATTIDPNIGQYYHGFIQPYAGTYGAGARVNRFFPSLGNHDWLTSAAGPYLNYFTLPGNERYYDFVRGPAHFFAIDSDPNEPDGITATSTQAQWLQSALAASTAPFNFVYFHHPAYSSAQHGSEPNLQWPFRAWGADAVLNGHDHNYERILFDGFPYFVNGLGGAALSTFTSPSVSGSALRFNADWGAMLVEVSGDLATIRLITRGGIVQDMISLGPQPADFPEQTLIAAGSTWKYRDDGSNLGTAWRVNPYSEAGWSMGPAQLGYGDGDEATLVSSGPPSPNHTITTYFRRTFQVNDPALFRALRLEIVRDDGAVVYVNGVEVYRGNMPSGTVGFITLASASTANENSFFTADVPASALVLGTNLVAVELHQVSGSSADASFDLRLTGTLEGTKLSSHGATWKYRDSGIDPGPAWKTPAFNDSNWASGPAQLGYGDGDEATVVSYGADPSNRYITTWFRRSFSVANAAQYQGLLLRLLRDDGAIVYLNGHEVFRQNLPFAGLSASSTAALAVAGADEDAFIDTLIDSRLLLDGVNVLAVEIHQSSGQSSDVSFDLELIGL